MGAFGNMIPKYLKYLTVGTEAGNSRRVEMPKGSTITKAALERALSEIHPDRETALELVRIRIYRLCPGVGALHGPGPAAALPSTSVEAGWPLRRAEPITTLYSGGEVATAGLRLTSAARMTQIRHRLTKACGGVHVRIEEERPRLGARTASPLSPAGPSA
jgi:hypothetical protein